MTEDEYWPSLEYRVTREFAGIEDEALRPLWCDGFIPENYLVDDADPRITGKVWICTGPLQHRWEFRLDIDHPVRGQDDVPWANLLPSNERTGWLTVDVDGRKIHITPR